MDQEPEIGYVGFNPPVAIRSPQCYRVWEIIKEMGIWSQVAFCYQGQMELVGLAFPTKQQAMVFRLKL